MSTDTSKTLEILKNNLSFAHRQLRAVGLTIEELFPESWRPLGIKTEESLAGLGKMNLELLSRSPMGDKPEAKVLLGAAICVAKRKPVFAPLRQPAGPVAYMQGEEEEVLYLCSETGRFAAGRYRMGSENHDKIISIYSPAGPNGEHEMRIAHVCHINDPYLLLPREIEILSTDTDYRLRWMKAIMMRVEAAGGLESYREEVHNDDFDFARLDTALVNYGYARENGERPYDDFLNDGSVR